MYFSVMTSHLDKPGHESPLGAQSRINPILLPPQKGTKEGHRSKSTTE
jgi:hypothetical protein